MNVNSFLSLLDKGISLDQVYLLSQIQQGVDISEVEKHKKGKLILQALNRKGLIDKIGIKLEGLLFINLFNDIVLPSVEFKSEEIVVPDKENNLELFIEKLRKSLGDKLEALIGKRQIMGFGNTYFIPTKGELKLFLPRFIKHHKDLWNEEKIEKLLHNHIERCARSKKYAPACKYYIYHDDRGSALAAALENYKQEEIEQSNIITYEGTNF